MSRLLGIIYQQIWPKFLIGFGPSTDQAWYIITVSFIIFGCSVFLTHFFSKMIMGTFFSWSQNYNDLHCHFVDHASLLVLRGRFAFTERIVGSFGKEKVLKKLLTKTPHLAKQFSSVTAKTSNGSMVSLNDDVNQEVEVVNKKQKRANCGGCCSCRPEAAVHPLTS